MILDIQERQVDEINIDGRVKFDTPIASVAPWSFGYVSPKMHRLIEACNRVVSVPKPIRD